MYHVKQLSDSKYKIYELQDAATNSWVKVAPERGGIIFSYGVEGEELLYLNEETFYDTDKNVRGGIPILFPISGQLYDGIYEWDGTTYSMNNHGFARNAAWEVIDSEMEGRASLTIKMTSNEQTKISYPFDFEVLFTYVLKKGKLTIHQEYMNMGNQPMPMYAGFHPYFKTSEKHLSYETDATRYFDYNDHEEKEFKGSVDLGSLKEAIVLLDGSQPSISFNLPSLKKTVKINYIEPFKYIMLWTEADKEFVCVEPWMAKTDEFKRKEELTMINENESLKTEISIQLEPYNV
ncbi:aldose epimerase [Fictibacillus norfolkensis]|uniref:Aldose epimerase n=1 Tax=Fictibacillus norfolkensis TaxID=2762233 RepID=A0ABR8SN63_9BACL|nr:aldose epimerase [Fictibacillus norfolkensis]MBD7964860.1 aldose epimerase [Fictibacillus norfolkensis]